MSYTPPEQEIAASLDVGKQMSIYLASCAVCGKGIGIDDPAITVRFHDHGHRMKRYETNVYTGGIIHPQCAVTLNPEIVRISKQIA